ncbi:MAG TPA: hypothetical protein VFT42_05520 [Solirubrobacteraceae bacterium]|nr:hypothetical protein [Solirubrobacteraceae bacterium]
MEELGIAATEDRLAGSDAERRAARALASALRAQGREVRTRTFWVRPEWAAPQALCAAAGVAASVLSVSHHVAAVALAGAALVLAVLDTTRFALLRRLTMSRATQNVIAGPAQTSAPVTLIVTAAVDRPRGGVLRRIPVPLLWHALALALVTGFAVARLLGAGGTALGIGQLIPTAVLVLATGAFTEVALGDAAGDDDSAPVAALRVARALAQAPPRRLAVEVVLAGAGGAHALGLARFVRAERRRRHAEEVAVLHIEPCAGGDPVWWTHDGLLFPQRLHPTLTGLAKRAAAEESYLRARPLRGPADTGARPARGAGWPALAVGARGPGGRSGEEAVDATVELCLAVIARLDRELGASAAPAPAPRTSPAPPGSEGTPGSPPARAAGPSGSA